MIGIRLLLSCTALWTSFGLGLLQCHGRSIIRDSADSVILYHALTNPCVFKGRIHLQYTGVCSESGSDVLWIIMGKSIF